MMDREKQLRRLSWEDIKLFLAVAESGSLSGAARQLNLGQPTLSRRIAELEELVGEALFLRKSQGCELTGTGLALLPAARQMAQWAEEAIASLYGQGEAAAGKVRITAPPGVAFGLVPAVAAELACLAPGIQLEVLSSLSTFNLARGEADIAMRTTLNPDDDLVVLCTLTSDMQVCVSPHYAATLPDNPPLADLRWICWPDTHQHLQINQVLSREIPGFRPAFTSDDFNVQVAACHAGVGAMVLFKSIRTNSMCKDLVALPIDITRYGAGKLYVVAHKRMAYQPKIKRVTEAIEKVLLTGEESYPE